MTKYVSLEHAIRNAVRDQQYKKPLNEDKEWEKDSAAVKASKDPEFINKMIDKWGHRGGAWLNHPAITGADKNKPVNEDFEFEMARNELRTAIDAAKRLMAHLDGDGELEAWVQSKITKGADYLDTVADYMDSRDTKKLKEETEELVETMSIINSKFKGNSYTTPVRIAPGVTQAAVRSAGHRRMQKQSDSATMQGKAVNEAKKEEKEDGDKTPEKKEIDAKYPTLNKVGDWIGNSITSIEKNIPSASDIRKKTADVLGTEAPTPEDETKLNKWEGAAKGAAFVGSAFLPLKVPFLKGKSSLTGPKITPKSVAEPIVPKPSIEPVKPPTAPAPKVPETPAPTAASKASDLVPSEFKSTKAPTPASDNIPGAPKPTVAEPATPKAAPETTQPAGKKPANQNLEPEVKGTGTEGLPAPNPKTAEPPRTKTPYDTGVRTTKEAPPTPANVNKPDVVPQGTPSPGSTTPLPGVKITNKPVGPKPANVPEPATAPAPKPNGKPAPRQAPSAAPKPAPVKAPAAAPKSAPKPAPKPNGKPAPNGKKPPTPPGRKLLPIPLPSLGRSDYKAPAGSNEYHDVPVKTSVSQARGHRKFGSTSVSRFRNFREETGPDNTRRKDSSKELVGRPDSAGVKDPKSVLARNGSIKTKIIEDKKLAGVVKSVVKKKKEEKESGPNPLVDFEPKLNHKYDNET
jgi:hypothetical protein